LIFKVQIEQADGASPIHAIALRCQLRLEPAKRQYTESEKHRLLELFGRPSQWSQTLRPMLWTHTSAIVPAFTAQTIADLPVPCTYDFNVAMTKYFDALEGGQAPISLLFSGTVFYQNDSAELQAAPISWEKEADYRLPIQTWRDMMHRHYPDQIPLSLPKPTIDRLREYKTQMGFMTFEQAIDQLLACAQQEAAE
jgi:Family of unknown function (DUF6084)